MASRQALILQLRGCVCISLGVMPTVTLAITLAVLPTGCGSNARAPVEDRNTRSPRPVAPLVSTSKSPYQVQRGDTLYSIAFRYGLDFRKVAAANRIPAPYTIYPGQRIYLFETPLPAVIAKAPAPRPTPKTKPKPETASSAANPSPKPKPKPKLKPKPVPTTSAPNPVPVPAKIFTGSAVSKWRWPTNGTVTRGYSSNVHKGIDIGGKRGDTIQAVAPGKVVYSGTGIVGFGELLIIKHNEQYLSAYGHNDRLLVREGQLVKTGQAIARKGSSGTDTVKLHFEIRKEGKPIDPQRLLPKR